MFLKCLFAAHMCNGLEFVQAVAIGNTVLNNRAGLCTDGTHSQSEALVLNTCHADSPSTWKSGYNVINTCTVYLYIVSCNNQCESVLYYFLKIKCYVHMQVIITHYIALDYYNIICLLQASALLYQKVDIKLLEEDVKLNMFWIVYIGIVNTRTHVYTFDQTPFLLILDHAQP